MGLAEVKLLEVGELDQLDPRAAAASDGILARLEDRLYMRKDLVWVSAGHSASANGAHSRSDASTYTDCSASMVGNATCTTAVWKVLGSRRSCSVRGVEVTLRILITNSWGRAPRSCRRLLCDSTVTYVEGNISI